MSDIQNIKIRFVADADFSDLDQSINKLTAEEKALKEQLKGVDQAAKAAGKSLTEETQKADKAVQNTNKGFGDLKGQVKGFAQQMPGAFQVEQIVNFSKSIQTATASTGGLSGAMGVLRGAIIATGIGALVLALIAVATYFTQTERGADRLAKIMSTLKVVVVAITNAVSYLGEIILDTVVYAFELWLQGAEKIYEFLAGTLFKALETLGKALSEVGFEGAAEMVNQLNTTLKQGKADIEKYTGSLKKLGEEIADLEDKLGAMSIDISLANNRLTTEIDKTLKALRNRNNTYAESMALIDKVAKAEEKKLQNTKDLVQVELDLKEKQFLRDENNTEKAKKQFQDFINGKITAEKLLDEVRGKANEDSIREIAEVLNKREDAVRESLVLEERLNNLREQFAVKERERQEKLKGFYDLQNRYRAQNLDLEKKDNLNELKAYGDKLDGKKKLEEEYYKIKEKQRKKDEEANRAVEERDLKEAEEYEKVRKGLLQQSLVTSTDIVNGLYELSKENNDKALSDLEKKHQAELKGVGDNKQAQAIINAKFAKEEAAIKTKQAQQDKAQAIFSIGIKTAQAVIAQMAATPLPIGAPLIALVAATGAAQLALAASKPIPKFNKGTKSVPGFDSGDDSVYAMLRPGEGVMPVDRMKDYGPAFNAIFDRKIPAELLNSFIMDYGKFDRMINVNPQVNDMSGLRNELKGLRKDLSKLQVLQVNMDQKGFKTYLAKENSKSQLENNYLRVE